MQQKSWCWWQQQVGGRRAQTTINLTRQGQYGGYNGDGNGKNDNDGSGGNKGAGGSQKADGNGGSNKAAADGRKQKNQLKAATVMATTMVDQVSAAATTISAAAARMPWLTKVCCWPLTWGLWKVYYRLNCI